MNLEVIEGVIIDMTEVKNIQIGIQEETAKPKSAQKPMRKRYPLEDPLRKCRHFIFCGKTRLTIEEYLNRFFRIKRRRKDRLTIVTLKYLLLRKEL